MSSREVLRKLVNERRGVLVAGAFNALAARVVANHGFEAIFIAGSGIANMHMGVPDLGFVGLAETAEYTARIRDNVDLPLLVDGGNGFGNPVNTYRTVQILERAGADAVQIEDLVYPKRCGHFGEKEVVSIKEMEANIRAAVDARRDSNLMIIGRTDAAAMHGFEAAMERAQRIGEAGADILFVETVEKEDELRQIAKYVKKPLMINIVIGGKKPALDAKAFGDMGFNLVLYANAALQGAVSGMNKVLARLKQNGRMEEDPSIVATYNERLRLVDKEFFDNLERKYQA